MASKPKKPQHDSEQVGSVENLVKACFGGDAQHARELLQAGVDVNAKVKVKFCDQNYTSLMAASEGCHLECVRLLIQSGADVNVRNKEFETALSVAARWRRLSCVQELIKAGADVKCKKALIEACAWEEVGCVRELIGAGAPATKAALVEACRSKSTECVKELIKAGAPVSEAVLEEVSRYSLTYSLTEECVKELLKLGPIGEAALKLACHRGLTECVKDLIKAGAPVTQAALKAACEKGHAECVRELIKAGADVKNSEYALISSVFASSSDSLDDDAPAAVIAELLLDAGADVNAQDGTDESALSCAAWQGRADVVRVLISRGANINLRRDEGRRTALIRAAEGDNTDCVSHLIEAGADVNAVDDREMSALWLALEREVRGELDVNIVRLLLKGGASVSDNHHFSRYLSRAV